MSTTIVPFQVTPESTVGELVAARPGLARHFEQLGIDYCCGGRQTLVAACLDRGLDLSATITRLNLAAADSSADSGDLDVTALSLSALADHIESTHHAYLKEELPRLVEMADRVATKHAWRDSRLREVAAAVQDLAQEMLSHMQKEERVLFPLIRKIGSVHLDGLDADLLAQPIQQMELEHEAAGQLTADLRELTDGFTPDGEACNTHRALLAGLAEFEADLHHHVHKENNVLFPRALLALAGRGQ